MAGNPNWWSSSSGIHRQSQHIPSFLSTSSPFFASQYASEPSSQVFNSSADHDYQDFPQSWSQLLRGGFAGEGVRHGSSPFQVKKYDNWEDQILNPSLRIPVVGVKQEVTQSCQLHNQEEDVAQGVRSYWSQVFMPPISSPRSCITTSSSNILDFYSNTKNQQYPDHSYECNSTATGGVPKKARVRASLTQPPLKVRKEKLGGRITALHQLVSPFGKTDTASILLEVIGYIRFLQGQIEALSFPYLGNVSASMRHQQSVQEGRNYLYPEEAGQLYNDNCLKRRGAPYNQAPFLASYPTYLETKQDPPLKDLRSRGLCLVPVSSTHHVGSDTRADFWAPAIGGGF